MTAISADPSEPDAPGAPGLQSRNRIRGLFWGVLAALPSCVWLWGFTVDDALISARVAANLAGGLGYRFNPHGPVVDAVTPLGYAPLLALFGRRDVLATFRVAKWLGLLAWLAAAGAVGLLVDRSGERARRWTPFAIVAVSAPLAAWAASGMETGLVTLLATLGLFGGAPGALAVGVAAAWRPELLPYAAVLSAALAHCEGVTRARGTLRLGLALFPALLVALVRELCFGRAVPLSFYAKPSDFEHGLRYALGAFAFTGLPWLLLVGPGEFSALPRRARGLLVACGAHWLALVFCGGDWMALFRLAVPVLPGVALAAALIAEQARLAPSLVRLTLASAGSLILAIFRGPDARAVGAERLALIAEARPVLAHDTSVVALDVGWVGAASDADVVDLAGVTDATAAFFAGGHTSKRIPAAWLFAHRPSAVVLLLSPGADLQDPYDPSAFAFPVQQRVAQLVASEFHVRTSLHLASQRYVVLEPNAKP